jgi:hypothetical protein
MVMKAQAFRYYRGSRDSREVIEIDLTKGDGTYITTCVVNVDLLLCGINSHPCGNGDDLKLDPETRLKTLQYLQEERRKLTEGVGVKDVDGWLKSGLPSFEDYCQPGDEVAEDIVDHFVNSVPPLTLRSDCTQAGETYSCELGEDGRYRNTYTTFHRIDNERWVFDGQCFRGENKNRVNRPSRVEELIREARKEADHV